MVIRKGRAESIDYGSYAEKFKTDRMYGPNKDDSSDSKSTAWLKSPTKAAFATEKASGKGDKKGGKYEPKNGWNRPCDHYRKKWEMGRLPRYTHYGRTSRQVK